MTLLEILKSKGSVVYTILPEATLEDATREMVRYNVGSLVVCDRDVCEGERPLGIISERDILRFCVSGNGPLAAVKVSDAMSARLVTGSPDQSMEEAMGVMTRTRIRHLPIVAEGRLVGIVSIGDLVKNQLEQLAMENHFMKSYIAG